MTTRRWSREDGVEQVFGGVEGGGTKFVCLVGTGPADIRDEIRFPTTTPGETLARVLEFFQRPRAGLDLAAVGVASFGPIDLDRASPAYGRITTTPKEGWPNTDVVGLLRAALGVPVGWDTDTNGAALGERRWGAGGALDPLVYVTVGTGIGGGVIVDGQPVHGLMHPEVGHLLVPSFGGDTFPGICLYHGHCLEGVASGPALHARLGRPPQDVPPDDPVWELEAQYLACGFLSISEVVSPQRIIVGGGVAAVEGLLDRVRRHLVDLNKGYIARLAVPDFVREYIVPPGLGGHAGVLGALELARLAYDADAGADGDREKERA